MKATHRLLIALLATAGASAAFAQSSVTLYGRVNTSVERVKSGDQTTTGVYDNASRWGIRGTEDLGGGLKAGFALESGFDSSTGAAAPVFFGRQSEVNLAGNFGMLRLGRWISESYFAVADYGVLDQPNHDTGHVSDQLYQYVMRDTNKIGYRTPNFGGFTLDAAVSLHEQVSGTGGKNAYDLAANWEGGPLAFGGGYTKNGDISQFGLRGHFTTGPFQIGGYYQRADDKSVTNLGKRNSARVTGMYAFGASEVVLGYGWAGKWSNLADSSANQLVLGYNYNLSKRTKVYGAYTKVNNKAGASYAGVAAAGQDFSTFALGIRHNF
ncbi:MAG: porin [Acidovorax sp.]